MGKGTASERPLEIPRHGNGQIGVERTLDPVAERFPASPADGAPEWHGYPAAMPFASAVRQSIQSAAIDRMVCPDDTADVMLAASEAFANAVRHGESATQDLVWVRHEWRSRGVTVRLRYRGAPFPTAPPQLPPLDSTSGRGRYIMSRLMDQVEYRFQDGWTEVTLARRLRGSDRTAVRS